VDIHGDWSITRSYYRSCPRCGFPVVRTVPWVITQTGADVRVDRGPRGTVTGAGPAYLSLEGTESDGFGVQRFWYATLFVSVDGNSFEGTFNGSERGANPCGDEPPAVTCFVSAGWVRGTRIRPFATPPPLPPPPGPPTAPAPATATVAPPVVATASPTAPPPGTPSPTATNAPTARPLAGAARTAFLPRAWAGGPIR
jgi:hypothetical protein